MTGVAGVFGVATLSSTSQASPNSILTYALRKNYHILHFKSELYLLLGNEANTDRNWVGGNIWLNYAHIYSTTSMNNNEHALVSPISCLCSRCWWRGSIVKHHIPHHWHCQHTIFLFSELEDRNQEDCNLFNNLYCLNRHWCKFSKPKVGLNLLPISRFSHNHSFLLTLALKTRTHVMALLVPPWSKSKPGWNWIPAWSKSLYSTNQQMVMTGNKHLYYT